ncbi:alpha/beta hydrolase [Desulfovibrio inopinatus]|uniref:alpha/beta hydrolase n=1 Tax=Desulfovibrio inopinatus TaxID=102109 RepID=UPI0004000345|nr:alpha/beta hydrolase [Desulfovibrio inopinatus]
MKTIPLTPQHRDGSRLSAELHLPERDIRGVALLLHGLLSSQRSSTNTTLIPILNDASIASLSFDFMGHGDSDGELKDICISSGVEGVSATLTATREHFPNMASFPLVVFGSSFGGAVALASAPYMSPCGVVLKSPALDIAGFQRQIRGDAIMQQWKEDGVLSLPEFGPDIALSYRFISDSLGYDSYTLAQACSCSFAIVHGTVDEAVTVEQSRRLALLLGDRCRFLEIDSGDHRFSRPEDFTHALDFCAASIIDMMQS